MRFVRTAPGHLSPRERQCLALMVLGLTPGQAGRWLGLSINTVNTYLKVAYRHLGVNCLLSAVRRTDLWGMAEADLWRVAEGREVVR